MRKAIHYPYTIHNSSTGSNWRLNLCSMALYIEILVSVNYQLRGDIMGQRITTVCMDCKKIIHQGATSVESLNISHGLCEACEVKLMWIEGLDQYELEGVIYHAQSRQTNH